MNPLLDQEQPKDLETTWTQLSDNARSVAQMTFLQGDIDEDLAAELMEVFPVMNEDGSDFDFSAGIEELGTEGLAFHTTRIEQFRAQLETIVAANPAIVSALSLKGRVANPEEAIYLELYQDIKEYERAKGEKPEVMLLNDKPIYKLAPEVIAFLKAKFSLK
jgi:hypothetical protein